MAQLSPDQLDDVTKRSSTRILYKHKTGQRDLDPRLALLHELNEELAKGGSAGTHAYDMMAAVEDINAGQTAVLIELVAGLILAKGWEQQVKFMDKAGSIGTIRSVTFAPSDIDDMQRAYDMDVKRDGMHVTVTLTKKAEPTESWQLNEGEDGAGAKEQAPAAPERPVWAIRDGTRIMFDAPDRPSVEEHFRNANYLTASAHIENRFCNHHECPSTGCNQAEVTSGA